MSGKYQLVFTSEFLKRLKKLDREAQIRVLKGVKVLEENPFSGKRLRGSLSGLLSLRIGDYRIIYQVSKDEVIIRTFGHRKSIYER
ncbi:type II toxin-antitoxin system RelE/ParE family toxin [Candidatus Bathyarchaeota archaeon]|nr:type II toxin-antitoxin system RelE/ParE family toxin [Candidatus Bathyarchaeota archaeon]